MKIKARKNYRVTIIPDEPWFLETDNLGMTDKNFVKWASACEDITNQVNRHVDGHIEVYQEHDSGEICSFCESEWEEENDGCPVCCQKAVDEWEAKKTGGDAGSG